jgi:ADP-ribose pyrophosphatase
MAPKPWTIVSSHRDKSYRVFNLRTDLACSPRTNRIHDFFILESSPWVNIIPLTPENEVVLVHQYRHGIRSVTLEIPGGLVEPNDSPEEAARRELLEETGYREKSLISLGIVHPNPAIQNNLCYTFLAKDVYYAGKQSQDEREDIEVVLKSLSDIPRLIKEGVITHSLVIVAFYRFYMEYLQKLR